MLIELSPVEEIVIEGEIVVFVWVRSVAREGYVISLEGGVVDEEIFSMRFKAISPVSEATYGDSV